MYDSLVFYRRPVDTRNEVQTTGHIWISRSLAVVAFGMFLVLTPRAWVDASGPTVTDEVPVNVLETPAECLWCDPAPSSEDCDGEGSADQPRMWLNPEQPINPLHTPCQKKAEDPSS